MIGSLGWERLEIKGVNAKTIASTQIGTTENGVRRFFPMFSTFHVTSANAIITPCTLSIGTNSAPYNNILAAAALTGLTALDTMLHLQVGLVSMGSVASNTGIFTNISVAATATTMLIDITLWGFYK